MLQIDFDFGYPGFLQPIGGGVFAFVANNLPPKLDLTPEIVEADEAALLALGGLQQIIPALPNPALLTTPFIRREAVLSSRIEGTKTTIRQLYIFEMQGKIDGIKGEDDADRALRGALRVDQNLATAEQPAHAPIRTDDAKGAIDRKRLVDDVLDLPGRPAIFRMCAGVDLGIGRFDLSRFETEQGIEARRPIHLIGLDVPTPETRAALFFYESKRLAGP